MKIYKLIAGCCILLNSYASAQPANNSEPVTAETFIELAAGESSVFAISTLKAQNTATGFALVWQTLNETGVASFQLEAGEDNKQLRIIKTISPAANGQPNNQYQLDFNLPAVQLENAYFRIKVNFTNGTSVYGDVVAVRMKKS